MRAAGGVAGEDRLHQFGDALVGIGTRQAGDIFIDVGVPERLVAASVKEVAAMSASIG